MPSSTRRRTCVVAIAALIAGAPALACTSRPRPTPTTPPTTASPNPTGELRRPADPVVLTGAQLSGLNGAAPDRVVAFRAAGGRWEQVPVQVDERVATTMNAVYGVPATQRFGAYPASVNIPVTVYADPGTFVGADPNTALDADDEVVFMARDAGATATGLSAPAGTQGRGLQVTLTDPVDPGATGYVYLFRSDGSLDPAAGKRYVDYTFKLASGDYKSTYKRLDGPNPEDSTVRGATYTTHFSDRWLQDELMLTKGDRPTTDLIDRMKYDINLACARNENTFDNEEGAFVVNRSGPVRALRSYVGSNSGPNTQNTQLFYDQAAYTQTDLRVHAIPNVGAHLDLSQAATGMTLRSPAVPGGVTIDGRPDTMPAATPSWWTYQGGQGGMAVSTTFDTNATSAPVAQYEDNLTASTNARCTGDTQAIGDYGARFNSWINCTDPGMGAQCTSHLHSVYRWVATPASTTPAELQRLAEQGLKPLAAAVSPF